MYETGTYTHTDKTEPGLYFQINEPSNVDYSTPFGGVALPVSFISSEPKTEFPTDAIAVSTDNFDSVFSKYTIPQSSIVKDMVNEILANASVAYLCPDNTVKDEIEHDQTQKPPVTGKGKYTSVEIDITGDNLPHEIYNGMKVVVSCTNNDNSHLHVQLLTPDGNELFKQANMPSINNLVKPEAYQIEIEGGGYNENPSGIYGDHPIKTYPVENLKAQFKIYVRAQMTLGQQDVYWLTGGYLKHAVLEEVVTPLVKTNDILSGCYALVDEKLTTEGNNTKRGRNDGDKNTLGVVIIKHTRANYNQRAGYYLHCKDSKASLMFQDSSTGSVETPQPVQIEETNYLATDTIYVILNKFESLFCCPTLSVSLDHNSTFLKEVGDNELYLGFSPMFPPAKTTDRMKAFCECAGKTPADILYFPYWSDGLNDNTERVDIKNTYQDIQTVFINNRESLCPMAQLVMDECLFKEGRTWVTDNPFTLRKNPYLVSLRTGNGNKRASQMNGAYVSGLLTSMGAYRAASAAPYTGRAGVVLYTQSEIVNMYRNGIWVFHNQNGIKMVYIDRSAFSKEMSSGEASAKQWTVDWERNKTVRAVNTFAYAAGDMFINNYFNKELGEDIGQMLAGDLSAIVHSMAKRGAFELPDVDDIQVQRVGSDGYLAKIGLKMKNAPEKLYIKVGM